MFDRMTSGGAKSARGDVVLRLPPCLSSSIDRPEDRGDGPDGKPPPCSSDQQPVDRRCLPQRPIRLACLLPSSVEARGDPAASCKPLLGAAFELSMIDRRTSGGATAARPDVLLLLPPCMTSIIDRSLNVRRPDSKPPCSGDQQPADRRCLPRRPTPLACIRNPIAPPYISLNSAGHYSIVG